VNKTKLFFFMLPILISIQCSTEKDSKSTSMLTSFEKNEKTTATYYEVIQFYDELAKNNAALQMTPFGNTDSGKPLHELVLSTSGDFDPVSLRDNEKTILFVNNAIHPGEPCGVDATMMLTRDILLGKVEWPDDLVLVIVPFYNISGGLNRNSYSRANQIGPDAHGFRGNVQNLDLNRDFVKCDSRNAKSFNLLFNKWQPHVMIDNHTSNGADYQYVMTLIATQKDRLAPAMSEVMTRDMLPFLYDKMKQNGYEMTPYVHARNTPDEGIAGFLDYSRYSSGYASLHHTISFMPETHMLKPYKDRVLSTYAFMLGMINFLDDYGQNVRDAKKKDIEAYQRLSRIDIDWQLDFDKVDTLDFKGYEAAYKPSEVSGHSRLYYDNSKPYEKSIPFYNTYKASKSVKRPAAYIFPQAYDRIIERLKWNNVSFHQLSRDTMLDVEGYHITDYKDIPAYEGHYLHYDIKVESKQMKIQFFAGDYIIPSEQDACRYIVETLEPQGPDSYFAWNFFDGILMQKEHFSSYVFEDLAAQLLRENDQLRNDLEAKKKSDPNFAQDGRAQLDFVYKRSKYYESSHRRYPVYRLDHIPG
jgi:hypothetical protein